MNITPNILQLKFQKEKSTIKLNQILFKEINASLPS